MTSKTSPPRTDVASATSAAFGGLIALDLDACRLAVCLASCPKGAETPQFEYLQVTDALLGVFRDVARATLAALAAEWRAGDVVLRAYAAESKPGDEEIEHLDLAAYPTLQQQIASLAQVYTLNVFEADKAFIANLRFYAIVATPPDGDPITFFRIYTPKKELSRSHLFAAFFRDGQYDTVREPIFLFDSHLDCIACGDDLFILNKSNFQSMFRFFEVVRRNAQQALATLRAQLPIGNFDQFAHDCEGHLVKLVKLQNIAAKPYLARITIADLRRVIVRHSLRLEIQVIEGREVVVYDPADKWALLKLLDDDYLHSRLTNLDYEANGKRELP